jgi:hypothetical protein
LKERRIASVLELPITTYALNFSSLVQCIQQTHTVLQQQVNKAINQGLTIRNWLIGYYIPSISSHSLLGI